MQRRWLRKSGEVIYSSPFPLYKRSPAVSAVQHQNFTIRGLLLMYMMNFRHTGCCTLKYSESPTEVVWAVRSGDTKPSLRFRCAHNTLGQPQRLSGRL
jgi:hypothetical protein